MTEPQPTGQIKDAVKPTEENKPKVVIKHGDNRIRVCRDFRITIPAHALVFDLPAYYRVLSVEREGNRVRIEIEILKEGVKEKEEGGKE